MITHDEELCRARRARRDRGREPRRGARARRRAAASACRLLDEVLDRFGAADRVQPRAQARHARASTRGSRPRRWPPCEQRGLLGAHALLVLLRPGAGAAARSSRAPARIALLLSPQRAEQPLERARRLGAEAINPWRGLATPRAGRGRPRRGPRRLRLHGGRARRDAAPARARASTASSRTSPTGCGALVESPAGR